MSTPESPSDEEQVHLDRLAREDAMERLRDRTDELELIISSLTIFALFATPGWLFDRFADNYTQLSTGLTIAGVTSLTVLAGVCYGLAACFVVHLMARAYWVGLIGLKTVFPSGIKWGKTPGLGPLSRQYYRDVLPDLETVIQKTDRLASSLFAVISMLTLSVLWLGCILVTTLVISGVIGARMGSTNAAMGVGTIALLVFFFGIPFLAYLLDAQLAKRIPRLQQNRFVVRLVRILRRTADLAYPRKLTLPVQLTLQTNTRPVLFFIALTLSIAAIVILGGTRLTAWRSFTLSGEYTFLNTEDAVSGFRSSHYEDMPDSLDRMRGWPRISSFEQSGSHVRLFLPYQPLRDNLILEAICGAAEQVPDKLDCLRQLWSISIEGSPVSMAGFTTAERADLGMRGLIGVVPLAGLEPGMLTIEVIWNPLAGDEDAPLDDRYTQARNTYTIPFAFSPAYELPLP